MKRKQIPSWIKGKLSVADLVSRGVKRVWLDEDGEVMAFIYKESAFFAHDISEQLSNEEIGDLCIDLVNGHYGHLTQ